VLVFNILTVVSINVNCYIYNGKGAVAVDCLAVPALASSHHVQKPLRLHWKTSRKLHVCLVTGNLTCMAVRPNIGDVSHTETRPACRERWDESVVKVTERVVDTTVCTQAMLGLKQLHTRIQGW
jgi:hypothetical protein